MNARGWSLVVVAGLLGVVSCGTDDTKAPSPDTSKEDAGPKELLIECKGGGDSTTATFSRCTCSVNDKLETLSLSCKVGGDKRRFCCAKGPWPQTRVGGPGACGCDSVNCYRESTELCSCGVLAPPSPGIGGSNAPMEECSPGAGQLCCKSATKCTCAVATACPTGETQVAKCEATPPACPTGEVSVDDCATAKVP